MLTYVFFSVAILQVGWAPELVSPGVGRALLAAMAGFWLLRTVVQPVFFGRSAKSWIFTAGWLLGCALHIGALWPA